MGDMPLVSVIIPCYNREKEIEISVNSVCLQTYKNIEIIIVDDYSSDNSVGHIKELMKKDYRLQLVEHHTNKGGGAARNSGILKASGELIAFLDSDDEWFPDKIEKQVEAIRADSRREIVFSGYNECGYPSRKVSYVRIQKNSTPIRLLLCENFLGTTSSIMCTADLLRRIGGFNDTLPSAQDWDLYLRAISEDNYFIIEEPLLNHFHPDIGSGNRISGNIAGKVEGLIFIINEVSALIESGRYKLTTDESRKVFCRLYYKLAKMYSSAGDYEEAKKQLKCARRYRFFDVRAFKLGLELIGKY